MSPMMIKLFIHVAEKPRSQGHPGNEVRAEAHG